MSHAYERVTTVEQKTNKACQEDNILIEKEKVKVEQLINRYLFSVCDRIKNF